MPDFSIYGPAEVVDSDNSHVYKVRLLDGSNLEMIVHASRLQFYHEADLNVTADLVARAKKFRLFEVEEIRSLSMRDGGFWCVVKWLGFEEEDNTEEPLANLYKDVPALVKRSFSAIKTPKEKDLGCKGKNCN